MPQKRKSVSDGTARKAKKPPVTSSKLTLMLVDDHPMWRDTLRKVLEHARVGTVVAEAPDGEEAIERAREAKPDLVIMDINLPGMSGIEAMRAMLVERPELKVLALSSSDERATVLEAVNSGASGYVLKTANPSEVADAVQRVHRGEIVFPPSLADLVLAEFRRLATSTPSSPVLRVLVADEAVLGREGLAGVLTAAGFVTTGRAGSAEELLELIEREPPDVAIVDVRMASRREGGISLAGRIRRRFSQVGVLVLSDDVTAADAVALMSDSDHGLGYVLKDRIAEVQELADAVQRVAGGESVIDPQVVRTLVTRPHRGRAIERLTEREREVLALMAEGRSNQAISERLFLGPKTIEAHVRNMFTKLGLEPAADDHRRVLAVLEFLRGA